MYNNEHDARYSSSYYRQQATQSPSAHRRPPSVVGAARHVHDDRYTLPPAHTLPSKDLNDPANRWDRYPTYENHHERPHSPPYYYPSSTLQSDSQQTTSSSSSRHGPPPPPPPMRQYAYTPREVDHEKSDLSLRREYSPARRERNVDGSFKGFTTPFPGSEVGGRRPDTLVDADVGRRPSYPRQHSPSNQRYSSHLSSAPNDNLRGSENDSRYRHQQYTNYNPSSHRPPPGQSLYSGNEPYRHGADDRNEMRGAASEQRYGASEVGSSVSQRGRGPHGYHERRWEEGSQYGRAPSIVDPADAMSTLDQARLSPRTFQRECQRAYYEARNQRMRNLEEGLYGKCKWATYDSKYC